MRRPERLEPGPGQESVWDYPRPPRLEVDPRHVVVRLGDTVLADTIRAWRICETASPPTFYLPLDDLTNGLLRPSTSRGSVCEWKGTATYYDVVCDDGVLPSVAWAYERPRAGFEEIAGAVSFYPRRVECTVDGERVQPQPGGFYGGWVTSELVGPWKGEPGTEGW